MWKWVRRIQVMRLRSFRTLLNINNVVDKIRMRTSREKSLEMLWEHSKLKHNFKPSLFSRQKHKHRRSGCKSAHSKFACLFARQAKYKENSKQFSSPCGPNLRGRHHNASLNTAFKVASRTNAHPARTPAKNSRTTKTAIVAVFYGN